MQITCKNINTVAYVIRKRLQGYKLLKNPKGSDINEINMIKTSFGLQPRYYDDVFLYHKIQRKIVNGKPQLIEKQLIAQYFMNPKTKQVTNKKAVFYSKQQNGQYVLSLEKQELSTKEQSQRLAKSSKDIFNGNIEEEMQYSKQRFTKERKQHFYQPKISVLEKIITLGTAKYLRSDNRPYAPGFFKTLISNLNGGR